MKKNIIVILVLVIFGILNLKAGDKKILPKKYYDEKNKNYWYKSEGGPGVTLMGDDEKNKKKLAKYTVSYMKLLDIFNKYYTNQNILKEEIEDEKYFFSVHSELLLNIKRIKGEGKYQKYRKMLFDFEVRKYALFIEKKRRMELSNSDRVSICNKNIFK